MQRLAVPCVQPGWFHPSWCGIVGLLGFLIAAQGADLESARDDYQSGRYTNCIASCEKAIANDESTEEWRLLLARSLVAVGRYTNAANVIATNLEQFRWSIHLRLLGREIYRMNGRLNEAQGLLEEINRLASYRMWNYQDAASLVTLGRAALLLGADPRRVLETFYDTAKRRDPNSREPVLASGQLALTKGDFELAAKTFRAGLKKFPEDVDFHFGLAQAFASSDRLEMISALEKVLELNTNHVASYLFLVDHLVDGEEYKAAEETLEKALAVNPREPKAWAYKAVIAHLRNETEAETQARTNALSAWKTNPDVDHLIGRKLSQKYRFSEGSQHQRQALSYEPKFLPARIQLAQDLLRLGQEEEGWRLAEQVHADDGYDVTAFNLLNLQDAMAKFATLTNETFVVRMATNEAVIYGQRVLSLLERARTTLCAKYSMTLEPPVIVEIFPKQKDFGVRTFGMPDNPGYLGVCFGSVITANSPASQAAHPANWEAVLWHEFCHVVTLQLTRNKMPRWLSEGISVFEELEGNPTWGQGMTPRYREMILGKDFTPLGDLSAAFLAPKTEMHLQFAYYESYLAVEFLVKKFGMDALKNILLELGSGTEINAAISKHTEPMEKLDKDFTAFARERAENLAPELNFKKPGLEGLAKLELELGAESKNYHTLIQLAREAIRKKEWQKAKAPLEKLIKLFPAQRGSENAYSILGEVHRRLGETNEERQVLTQLASVESDAIDAYQRLMELNRATGDWEAVTVNAERYIAVNPLVELPYRYLAEASAARQQPDTAIASYQTLLRLDPPDPAGTHFKLARLLHEKGEASAKRHLLQALEEAPRYREAHKLLLKLSGTDNAAQPTPSSAPAPGPAPAPAPTPGTVPK
jgi:tetratricopeptide (TPR) repeat protein